MEGWRQQTITKHPDTRGSFASGIRPQHRPWGAPHCSLGISFPIAPLINREQFATRPQPRLWGAVHRSLGISVPIAPLINRGQLQHRPWGAPHRSLGISFISAPCVQEKRERCPTKAVPRQAPRRCTGSPLISVDSLRPVSALITHIPWGAVHRSLGISVYPPDITYPEEVWAPVVVAVESA